MGGGALSAEEVDEVVQTIEAAVDVNTLHDAEEATPTMGTTVTTSKENETPVEWITNMPHPVTSY